jgi:hypothetical protein
MSEVQFIQSVVHRSELPHMRGHTEQRDEQRELRDEQRDEQRES